MKTKFALTLMALGTLALEPAALGNRLPSKGGGGGGGKAKVSKPTARPASKPAAKPANRPSPKPVSKPSGGSGSFKPSGGGGHSKPSVSKPSGGGGARLPQSKPAQRPSMPSAKPAERPSIGSSLPSGGGGNRPNIPSARPNLPSTKPSLPANRPNIPDRPTTLPGVKPATKPGGGDFIGMKPDRPNIDRPATLPGNITNKPGLPNHPGGRPTTLPGNIGDKPGIANRPGDRPTTLPGNLPDRPGTGRPERPTTLPGNVGNRPGIANRPERPTTLPGRVPGDRPIVDHRPGKPPRPPRPERPGNWQNVVSNNNNQWNNWRQDNQVNINNFQVNRTNNWNSINTRYTQPGWPNRYGSGEYREWRNDVWDYRRDRCEEVWDRRQDFWDDCFDNHWWGSCWWRPRPYVSVGVNVSPWWWWRPFAWAGAGAFFGAALSSPQPVVYDPGTTVIYEGDTYYINGKSAGTATDARRSAIQLATPAIAEIPVPEPPPEGQPETWMPLGVWALTQQEQGDATMFMQFSVDKNGLVAGAYKNVLTGDEQPIVGQVDTKAQRVAWHVGEATQTVYETGLSGLENDVVSVFVHFGEAQTQTWLLVRLPSPEIPPGTVKIPDLAKQ